MSHILILQIALSLKVLGQDFPLFLPAPSLHFELAANQCNLLLLFLLNRTFALYQRLFLGLQSGDYLDFAFNSIVIRNLEIKTDADLSTKMASSS